MDVVGQSADGRSQLTFDGDSGFAVVHPYEERPGQEYDELTTSTAACHLQVVDRAVVFVPFCEVGVDRFHDVSDLTAHLPDVDQARMFESTTLHEGQEVVVERQENAIVRDGVL